MKKDQIISIINHEENVVPSWTMAFFNIKTAQRLLGEENVVTDFYPEESYKAGATSNENRERNIIYSECIDNFAIGVGGGANFVFGHGGPGEFFDRMIERGDNYFISKIRRERYSCWRGG